MVARTKPQKKRPVDPYRTLARELREYTTRDYSKKRTLTPADKAALTKAANIVSSATFIRVKRNPRETERAYKRRVTELQRQHASPVSSGIRGIMVKAPHDAKGAKIRNGQVEWILPAIRTKKQGRPKKNVRVRTGYKIASARDPDYNPSEKIDRHDNPKWRPLTARIKAGIRAELVAAMKGLRKPVELEARVGHRLNSSRTVHGPNDPMFEVLLEEILHRLEEYQIRGFLQITARSS